MCGRRERAALNRNVANSRQKGVSKGKSLGELIASGGFRADRHWRLVLEGSQPDGVPDDAWEEIVGQARAYVRKKMGEERRRAEAVLAATELTPQEIAAYESLLAELPQPDGAPTPEYLAAVAIAVALVPGRFAGEREVGVIERALAAISQGPVIHAIVENADREALLLDLETGEEMVEPERYEYWYDEERNELRARITIGSEVLREIHVPRLSGPPPSERGLAFATRYREALESGKARLVRWETVAGRRAPVLSIAVPPWRAPRSDQVVQSGYTEEVVVDGETFEPLRFRHIPDVVTGPNVTAGPIHWWRVVAIESTDRDDEDFTAGPPPFRWIKFLPSNDKEVTVDEAATALGRTALWPGTDIDGVPLERLGVVTTTITWRDGRETTTPSLMIRYETTGAKKRWLWMDVGTSRETTPRFGPIDGEAVPAGKVRLMHVKARDDRSVGMWFGNVQRDGTYINIQSPERDLIVAAAKALTPLD